MISKPLVSVIMPNYNNEKYISKAIESFLDQSYSQKELIITDDESTDKSIQILKKFDEKFSNIKVIFNKHIGLPGEIRDISIKYSKGKYLFLLDSDDILLPDAISILVEKSEKKNLDVCYGNMAQIDSYGKIIKSKNKADNSFYPGRLIKTM